MSRDIEAEVTSLGIKRDVEWTDPAVRAQLRKELLENPDLWESEESKKAELRRNFEREMAKGPSPLGVNVSAVSSTEPLPQNPRDGMPCPKCSSPLQLLRAIGGGDAILLRCKDGCGQAYGD
jgi:hypothetical protein